MVNKHRAKACGICATALLSVCMLALLLPFSPCGAAPGSEAGPYLMRVLPSEGGMVGRDCTIALSFDRPMDLQSIVRSAYFEPPVDFTVSGESECLVVPVNLLEPDARYTFRMHPGTAEDRRGGVCDEGVEISFNTRGDGVIMEIPAFSYRDVVIEGEDPQGVASVIGFGVGHFPGTGRPGRGNFVVMAHASGRIDFPYNRLFELAEGDEISLTYGGRDYRYAWREGLVVRDTDMWIVEPTASPVITFFVCCAGDGKPSPTFHPPYRYAVRASLSGVSPPLSTQSSEGSSDNVGT